MKNVIFHGLTFVFGVAVGILCTREYYHNKYEEQIQERIDTMNKVMSRTKNGSSIAEKTQDDDTSSSSNSSVDTPSTDVRSSLKYGNLAPSTVEYGKYFDDQKDEEDGDTVWTGISDLEKRHEEVENEMAESEHPDEDSRPNHTPYIISEPIYSETRFEYAKCRFSYYADEALVDDESREIVEHSVVGENNLDLLNSGYSVIYVRNEAFAMDIEVTKLNKTIQQMGVAVYG